MILSKPFHSFIFPSHTLTYSLLFAINSARSLNHTSFDDHTFHFLSLSYFLFFHTVFLPPILFFPFWTYTSTSWIQVMKIMMLHIIIECFERNGVKNEGRDINRMFPSEVYLSPALSLLNWTTSLSFFHLISSTLLTMGIYGSILLLFFKSCCNRNGSMNELPSDVSIVRWSCCQ